MLNITPLEETTAVKEIIQISKDEGRDEGREEGQRETLRHLLLVKFGALTPAQSAILTEASGPQLIAWTEQIFAAKSIDTLLS